MDKFHIQAEIRKLAANRDKIVPTNHAQVREPGKGKYPISDRQTAQCLRNGHLIENPTPDIKMTDGWKFTCQRKQEETTTTVVGVVVPNERIIVITAYETRLFSRRRSTSRGEGAED